MSSSLIEGFLLVTHYLAPSSVGRYKAIASKLRECLGDKLAHQVNDSIDTNA